MGSPLLRRLRTIAPLALILTMPILPSPAFALATPADYGLEPADRSDALLRREALRLHNEARRKVGTPPLAWSEALAQDAARYAVEMARTGIFKHSSKASRSSVQGENLWMGTRDLYSYEVIVGTFLAEARHYRAGSRMPNLSTTGDWRDAGHYTQVIWRGTTEVGCAMASSKANDYFVCRYSPPGNVFGQGPED